MNSVNQNSDNSTKLSPLLSGDPTVSPSPTQKRNRTLIKIFFILVILLAFAAGSILMFLLHENVTRPPPFPVEVVDESITIFCSETHFFRSCLNSIGAKISPDRHKETYPDDIFAVALQIAFEELVNLSQLTQKSSESSLFQCRSLIHDSLEGINRSLGIGAGYLIFSRRIDDDPDDEMQREMLAHEKKEEMLAQVCDSVSYLEKCCHNATGEGTELTAMEEAYNAMVHATIVYDFLRRRDAIVVQLEELNARPYGDRLNYEFLWILVMFCPQYLVLIFMICLFLRWK